MLNSPEESKSIDMEYLSVPGEAAPALPESSAMLGPATRKAADRAIAVAIVFTFIVFLFLAEFFTDIE